MSHMLILVKYKLEDGIPIDDSSENITSTYAPPEFVDWAIENGLLCETRIRESTGQAADIPIAALDEEALRRIDEVEQYVQSKLIWLIEAAHTHISADVLRKKDINECFDSLRTWLELRETIRMKTESFGTNNNVKLVVG